MLRFRLSARVPRHNLYLRLAELLDWSFLYEQTRDFYSHTGQPSLAPVVFFKLMLVGRLENLVSDRRLVEHCALRLYILYFLGYDVEELPWHFTISRTRQLHPTAVFAHLFDQVFAQCLAAGLEVGQTQAIDSAPVKANASVAQLRTRLTKQQVPLREVLADAGYSNSCNYAFFEQRGITPRELPSRVSRLPGLPPQAHLRALGYPKEAGALAL